jgi:hypothetical protein
VIVHRTRGGKALEPPDHIEQFVPFHRLLYKNGKRLNIISITVKRSTSVRLSTVFGNRLLTHDLCLGEEDPSTQSVSYSTGS